MPGPARHQSVLVPHEVARQSAAPEQPKENTAARPVVQQIVDQIVSRLDVATRAGRTEFHLRLDPPNLGTVSVQLSIAENRLTARLIVHEEATRQVLARQLDTLRVQMQHAGVALGGFDVTRQDTGSHDHPKQRPPRRHASAPLGETVGVGEEPRWASPATRSSSMIDLVA